MQSKTPLSDKPEFDLDYSIHDVELNGRPDTHFLNGRIDQVLVAEGVARGGRTLDVACGVGRVAARITEQGGEGWGVDASTEMLGLSTFLFDRKLAVLVRGIAEELPFADGSFDRVLCQGSLDHFVDPAAFMREAARVVRPDGRVVIGLANYESLSCRIGRARRWFAGTLLRKAQDPSVRLYWQPPPDHYHKGDLDFVRKLGAPQLELERCYGVSLLWLMTWWDRVLAVLPGPLERGLLRSLDRIARVRPGVADVIVSVWRPAAGGER